MANSFHKEFVRIFIRIHHYNILSVSLQFKEVSALRLNKNQSKWKRKDEQKKKMQNEAKKEKLLTKYILRFVWA